VETEYVLMVWLAGAVPVAYGPYVSLSAAEAALNSYTSGQDNAQGSQGSVGATTLVELFPASAIPNQAL
jgi:hypothetical protein